MSWQNAAKVGSRRQDERGQDGGRLTTPQLRLALRSARLRAPGTGDSGATGFMNCEKGEGDDTHKIVRTNSRNFCQPVRKIGEE